MDHKHCQGCVNSYCTFSSDCPVEYCQNGCGVSLHRCKWAEHDKHTCSEALVCCINAVNGCREMLARKSLGSHLPHCPASILQCRFVHTRKAVCNAGETTLQEADNTIDEKLLSGDVSLVLDHTHQDPPTLGIFIKNSGYTTMEHRRNQVGRPQTGYMPHSNGTRQRCHQRISNEISFLCNQIVRRDEFVPHWKGFHLDVQLNLERVIQRCPLISYGCVHSRENLVPFPAGTTLNYDKEVDTFLASSPSPVLDRETEELTQYQAKIQEKKELALYGYGDEEESYDVLSQLPAEILLNIFKELDSISLWNMSLVSHYMRKLCFCVVYKRGIVYTKWTRAEDASYPLGFRWIGSPEVSISIHCDGWPRKYGNGP